MAAKSKIEWTDATWNPIRGCTRVSPGCGGPGPHGGCYAEGIAARFSGPGQAYEGIAEMRGGKPRWTGKLAFVESALTLPLRWRTARRIFVNSMSDLFHESVPDAWIDRVFAVMALCPQHTLQVLTKRSERMRAYLTQARTVGQSDILNRLAWDTTIEVMNLWHPQWKQEGINGSHRSRAIRAFSDWPLSNVWLGVSVEDQRRADERRDDLAALATAGWITFVSYEPALGPVDWTGWDFLAGAISGGESGPRARPSHPDWHRATRDFCAPRGILYLFKQWGAWAPMGDWYENHPVSLPLRTLTTDGWTDKPELVMPDAVWMVRLGKARAGRLLDGIEHNGMPATATPGFAASGARP